MITAYYKDYNSLAFAIQEEFNIECDYADSFTRILSDCGIAREERDYIKCEYYKIYDMVFSYMDMRENFTENGESFDESDFVKRYVGCVIFELMDIMREIYVNNFEGILII